LGLSTGSYAEDRAASCRSAVARAMSHATAQLPGAARVAGVGLIGGPTAQGLKSRIRTWKTGTAYWGWSRSQPAASRDDRYSSYVWAELIEALRGRWIPWSASAMATESPAYDLPTALLFLRSGGPGGDSWMFRRDSRDTTPGRGYKCAHVFTIVFTCSEG
jgi:hypothetical protein